MATITIMDPVTRIEGHLRVDLTIENNQVTAAKCSGELFRGFEVILQGRHPWDAPVITSKICGVCPISHTQAAVKAIDASNGLDPTDNGRRLRNLTLASNYVMSHILHFYVLAALDFVKVPELAVAPWEPLWDHDLRVTLPSSVVVDALTARRRAHQMGALLGGRMPASHAPLPTGFGTMPDASKRAEFRQHLLYLIDFINSAYLPHVLAVAAAYPDYYGVGTGYGNLLAYGVFELDAAGANKLLGRGRSEGGQSAVQPLDTAQITEEVKHAWYADSTSRRHPSVGQTQALHPKSGAYSWLKAPRYGQQPYEVGPLARMWVNGDYQNGVSVIDRHAARATECLKVANAMLGWLDELEANLDQPVYTPHAAPTEGTGIGLTEAPRGAIGHWVRHKNQQIDHYQVITPTCWNASPRDDRDQPGPLEYALVGTPVADPDKPIEALRVIHSFDPCLSCAVHVMRPRGQSVLAFRSRS